MKFDCFKIFFNMENFSSLFWIYYNIASALCLGFFSHKAGGILAPQPEIEPTLPALEGEVSTAGQPGKAPEALKLKNVSSHTRLLEIDTSYFVTLYFNFKLWLHLMSTMW